MLSFFSIVLTLNFLNQEGKITGFKKYNTNYRVRNAHLIIKRYGEIKRRLAELNRHFTYETYPPIRRFKRFAQKHAKQPVIIRLLVLRVEFQKEQPDDPKSTGDGTFVLTGNGEPMIIGTDCNGEPIYNPYYDPPHDWTYFNTLIEALADYYEAATYGKVRVEWVVKPDSGLPPYRVPHKMGYYSAWGQDPELGLVTFMRDAFRAADEDSTVSFEDIDNNGVKDYLEGVFDRYVIFHPGSAWQTDLNFDSPYDMPAVTVPAGALEYYLGVPYIVLNNGQDTVFDAEIMSETMSQDGIDVRINGTLFHESGHNMFFYPDLYDTRYNGSGVGAFGIMTTGTYLAAEGIPSGVLPPYPNAWTRLWTDWILKYLFGEGFVDHRILKVLSAREKPDTITLLPISVGIDSFSLRKNGNLYYTVPYFAENPYSGIRFLKVPVNAHEYFLFENLETNLTFNDTVICNDTARVFGKWKNGVLVHFFGENDYLEPADGILTWHVDERILWEYYPYNEVNAVRPMAVDVVEADHVQDFEKWTDLSPYAYTWFGCPYDTYFKGNNTILAPWTTPSSNDNENNLTNLVFIMPDTISESMRVIVEREKSISGFPIRIGYSVRDSNLYYMIINTPVKSYMEYDSVFAICQYIYVDSVDLTSLDTVTIDSFTLFSLVENAGNVIFEDSIGADRPISPPAILKTDSLLYIAMATQEGKIYFYTYQGDTVFRVWSQSTGNEIRGTISFGSFRDTLYVFAGSDDARLHLFDLRGNEKHTFRLSSPLRHGVGTLNSSLIFTQGTDGIIYIIDDRENVESIGNSYPAPYFSPFIVTRFPDTEIAFFSIKGNGHVEALNITGDIIWQRAFSGIPANYVAVGSYKDGAYFAFVLDSLLYVINSNGALMSGFPLSISDTTCGGIVTGDLNKDGQDEIIVAHGEHLDAYTVYGKKVYGFPLQASSSVQNPIICNLRNNNHLNIAYITSDGFIFAISEEIENSTQPHVYVNARHNLYVVPEIQHNTPKTHGISLLYIYPNPVKNGKAHLRFKVGFEGDGRIDFINFSGLMVKTQFFKFRGHAIEEIPLDIQGLEPDMYYLDIKFKGDYQSMEKVIKLFILSKGERR